MGETIAQENGAGLGLGQAVEARSVLQDQVDALFRQPLTMVPGGEFIAAAAALVAGFAADSRALLGCGIFLIVHGLVRLAAQLVFRRRSEAVASVPAALRWYRLYGMLSCASCAGIGAIGWFGASSGLAETRLLTACVVLAGCGTIGRAGTSPRLIFVQAALVLAPIAAGWAMIGTPVSLMMTVLVLPYFLLQLRIGRSLHALTHGSLAAAARTAVLIRHLEQKNALLEEQDAQLRAQTLRFDAALTNMAQGVAMFDADLTMMVCNHRYTEIYGFDPEVVKPGVHLRVIVDHYLACGNAQNSDAEEVYEVERRKLTGNEPINFTRAMADGRIVSVKYRPNVGGGYVVTTEDVTDQRRAADRIAHLASHDPLTDLCNRAELPRRIRKALATNRSGDDGQVAIFCLDLDAFKAVNDTLGHPIGDALLQAVADRLRQLVRAQDTVARLGGDEFVCVLSGIESRDAIANLAARLVEALSAPYDICGHEIEIGASLGIAVAPQDGADSDTLLRHADVALYRAKTQGGGQYLFFGPDMERILVERRQLEADLRAAATRNDMELYYQPIVNPNTRALLGFEALLRWNHPTRGLTMPQEFIGIAEETGLIVSLGEWALRRACEDAAAWPGNLKVAVNVSPLQFRSSSLLATVVSALAQSGLDATRLELEVTEAVLLRDSEEVLAMFSKLRALGVRIVMDDFGTGYSSLSYLRQFPFDKIKIDRSFVRECDSRGNSRAIIQAITDLASGLGIATTVEGVETEEQLLAVVARGCTEAQGYLFGVPQPVRELGRLLGKRDRKAA